MGLKLQSESFELVKQSRNKILGRALSCTQFLNFPQQVKKRKVVNKEIVKSIKRNPQSTQELLSFSTIKRHTYSELYNHTPNIKQHKSFIKIKSFNKQTKDYAVLNVNNSPTPRLLDMPSLIIERVAVEDKINTARKKEFPSIEQEIVLQSKLLNLSAMSLEVEYETHHSLNVAYLRNSRIEHNSVLL